MLLKRLYDDKLAQASYLIACQTTGEALVVDPLRDVDQYLAAAAAEGVRVTHVTETHIHADFASGARELAHVTGARLLLSDEGTADWKYAFAKESGATLLRHHDSFMIGNIRVDVLHTPGHTPEHLSFVITDTRATELPIGVLTGDFLFVGDVGRPDLLEKAAHMAGTMEASARTLFASLQAFKALPDHVQIWPGHGAGSACGKSLGAVPSSTLGYEKIANWGLSTTDEQTFVDAVLHGQPDPPLYFAEMKRMNKLGPALRSQAAVPVRLTLAQLNASLSSHTLVVDTRAAAVYAAGYVPGTINIPLTKSFNTWAGWLLPYDRDIVLIADEPALREAVRDLALIGLDRVVGFADLLVIAEYSAQGVAGKIPQMNAGQVAEQIHAGTLVVIDVRTTAEWEAGHLPGAVNIPLGHLQAHLAAVPTDRMVAVQCQSGGRSSIAASVLHATGRTGVANVAGGFVAWQAAGLSVVREASVPTAVAGDR